MVDGILIVCAMALNVNAYSKRSHFQDDKISKSSNTVYIANVELIHTTNDDDDNIEEIPLLIVVIILHITMVCRIVIQQVITKYNIFTHIYKCILK